MSGRSKKECIRWMVEAFFGLSLAEDRAAEMTEQLERIGRSFLAHSEAAELGPSDPTAFEEALLANRER